MKTLSFAFADPQTFPLQVLQKGTDDPVEGATVVVIKTDDYVTTDNTDKERWVSLEQKDRIIRYIQKAKQQNKTLYVYDEVGKQVRWL